MLSFLTIILISSPSYSSGITSNANSATCNNSTLETYTGTSNLQANWSANEITVKWYADSEAEQPMTTNTCFYGPNSELTIPSASSMVNLKPGYTFAGWRVRQSAQCSFAQSVCGLTASQVDSISYYDDWDDTDLYTAYNFDQHDDYSGCGHPRELFCQYSNQLSRGEWLALDENDGAIMGVASCNSTRPDVQFDVSYTDWQNLWYRDENKISTVWGDANGAGVRPGNAFSVSYTGQYCWCKMTSYTPAGGQTCNTPNACWVFLYDLTDVDCDNCAMHCAELFASWYLTPFRRAVFGVSQ